VAGRPTSTCSKCASTATKADIKAAVEQMFDVKVEASRGEREGQVQVASAFRRSRGDWRKAYVTLADGQSIDVMRSKA
jgi:large subunit ribosomal protein L23